MLDSISEMKAITPTIRPPILLEQAPITLTKLLERFMNGERKFAPCTPVDNNPGSPSPVTPGGVNIPATNGGGAMVEFADMFADNSDPLGSPTGVKANNNGTNDGTKPVSAAAAVTQKTPETAEGTPKALTPAAARLAKKQADLLATQIASLVKKQTLKTMTTLFNDFIGDNWRNYIQGEGLHF